MKLLLGKEIIGNPIISENDGRILGRVRDLYLDQSLTQMKGLYLGSEGVFNRNEFLIDRNDMVVLGKDAVLVTDNEVIQQEGEGSESDNWLRRDELQGRRVDTPGGTKIGVIDDGIFNREAEVVGFSLSRVYVDGPVAENRAFSRSAMKDPGYEDGILTVELSKIENDNLRVDFQSLFSMTGAKVTVEDETNSFDRMEKDSTNEVMQTKGAKK